LGSSTLNSIDFSNTVESHGSALFSIAHIAHQKLHNTLRQRSFNIEFTARQREIALLLLEGHTNKEMSYRLKVSIPTISFHLKDIREKLQVKTTREIVPKLLSLGWKG
jgi:DNA-binding CsgD family transcriptional regulator